jgi:outer membrane protein insertion porin family
MAAEPVVVSEVVVQGAAATDEGLILRTLAIPPGSTPTAGRIRRAVRNLWKLNLFSDVRLDAETTPAGEKLVVRVTEVPRVSTLEIAGNKKIGTEDLKGKLTLRAGQLLSREKLWESCRAVEAAYEEEGYAGATCLPEVMPDSGRENQAAVTLRVEEGSRVKITGIAITGNEAFDSKRLRGDLSLKPNSLFRRKRYTAERYREDRARLEEFYRNHGYRDATVEASGAQFGEDGKSVVLGYHVEEGPYYVFGNRSWAGNAAVTTETLEEAARFRPGDPFSQERLEQTTGEAYNLYTDRGYLLEISVVPETRVSGDSVYVAYQIQEGRPSKVREVQIRGNRQTKERVIRRELTLFPGDLLRRSLLMRSQRDVMALGFFNDVGLDYKPTGEGTDVDLIFNVTEKSTGQASGGVGYSSETGLTGFVQLGHPNLFGNGQSISLSLERGGRRENYEISFQDPWIFETPTSFGFDLFNTRRTRDLYTETRRGGGISLGRPWFYRFPDYTRVYVGYSIEDFKFSEFDPSLESSESASDGVPLADRLRDSSGLISSTYLSMLRNSTDNPFYPTLGARTQLRLEVAGGALGGDQHYFKPTVDHRIYFQPIGKPALMLRWRAGWLAGLGGKSTPTTETFRLGGTRPFEYLRGYDDYYIVPEENVRGTGSGQVRFPGGRAMLAFTAELQFPVVNPVHGLLFYDAGDTWNHATDVALTSLKESYGLGLRFEIPLLGNIGFDYAYGTAVKDWRFHFIVGSAF